MKTKITNIITLYLILFSLSFITYLMNPGDLNRELSVCHFTNCDRNCSELTINNKVVCIKNTYDICKNIASYFICDIENNKINIHQNYEDEEKNIRKNVFIFLIVSLLITFIFALFLTSIYICDYCTNSDTVSGIYIREYHDDPPNYHDIPVDNEDLLNDNN